MSTLLTNPLFSSREIATGLWTLVFLVAVLFGKKTRESLIRVMLTALGWKLLLPVLLLAAYVSAIIAGLAQLGWWTPDLLKESVLWFLLSGVALLFSGLGKGAEDRRFWRRLVLDQVAAIVLYEWLASAFTFSLAVELILAPCLFTVAMLDAVAATKEELAPVRKLTSWIMAAFGFYVLASGIGVVAAQFQLEDPTRALKAFVLGPTLSIAILPLAYALAVLSAFEMLLLRLRWAIPDEAQHLGGYAARRVFVRCGFSPRKVGQFTRVYLSYLHGARTRTDIDAVIRLSMSGRRKVPLLAAFAEA